MLHHRPVLSCSYVFRRFMRARIHLHDRILSERDLSIACGGLSALPDGAYRRCVKRVSISLALSGIGGWVNRWRKDRAKASIARARAAARLLLLLPQMRLPFASRTAADGNRPSDVHRLKRRSLVLVVRRRTVYIGNVALLLPPCARLMPATVERRRLDSPRPQIIGQQRKKDAPHRELERRREYGGAIKAVALTYRSAEDPCSSPGIIAKTRRCSGQGDASGRRCCQSVASR